MGKILDGKKCNSKKFDRKKCNAKKVCYLSVKFFLGYTFFCRIFFWLHFFLSNFFCTTLFSVEFFLHYTFFCRVLMRFLAERTWASRIRRVFFNLCYSKKTFINFNKSFILGYICLYFREIREQKIQKFPQMKKISEKNALKIEFF